MKIRNSNLVLLTRTRTCPSFSTRSPLSRSTWTVSSRLKLLLTVTQINLEEKWNWNFIRPVKFGEFCFAFFIFKSICELIRNFRSIFSIPSELGCSWSRVQALNIINLEKVLIAQVEVNGFWNNNSTAIWTN